MCDMSVKQINREKRKEYAKSRKNELCDRIVAVLAVIVCVLTVMSYLL